jgi:hypothetical protein
MRRKNVKLRPALSMLASCLLVICACQQMPVPQAAKAARAREDTNQQQKLAQSETFLPPRVIGILQDSAINESSGIVASRTTPGLYWTHNDSGDGPYIYALDEHGARRGTWRVKGASARD